MGILAGLDNRSVTLLFPAGDCTRRYSRSGPPIRRIRFKSGDMIQSLSGQELKVETISEARGLFTYIQGDEQICETELSPRIDLDLPFDRLMSGLGSGPGLFDLRLRLRKAQAVYQASEARGFLGGQVDLIPHQFYIAGQVCGRYFPRVLLSDETGLGKTVEAGLVIHRLLTAGRIRRVLVIVPRSLVHQWFIELFRKFSLGFCLFDEGYCREARLSDPDMNPFSREQCGIIAQDTVLSRPDIPAMLLEAGWDMVVMDEAHHMTDDPVFFRFMAGLGRQTPGLMLLTATPEQMGLETHFAQLHLLDLDELTLELLPALLDKSHILAGKRARRMRQESLDRMKQILGKEQIRLTELARNNPGITDREMAAAKQEEERLGQIMARAALRLDAVRLIRLSPSR
jgi:ATP-dependent helicase HepA